MDEILIDSLMNAQAVMAEQLASLKAAQASTSEQSAMGLFTGNNVWMMLCTALVFIMHLGFACVESGFTQSKNTVNILFKNTLTISIGILSYAIIGFALMYPGDFGIISGVLGFAGFLDPGEAGQTLAYTDGAYTYWTDFLFQGMFAATAATIVSGAVAERIKIDSYLLFTILFVGLAYPVIGSWQWGGGFLSTLELGGMDAEGNPLGFYDFAGSTLVHSVGGWAALAGVILIGPRIGKYVDGKIDTPPGSSVPLATIGVFLLWLGWFGFNGGSVLSADPAATSLVLVTTCIAAAAGAIGATVTIYFAQRNLDLGMALNGILAGLVGITAGADQMSVMDAGWIGLISGFLVVISVITLDKLKLDDPVGAISVHLTCGVFGTLAVGLFGAKAGFGQLINQLVGIAACGATAFVVAFGIFYILKTSGGIRVSEEHEIAGLDSHEHGMRGYTILSHD